MIDPITALAAVSSAVNLVKKAVKTVQDVQSLGPVLGQYFDAKAQAIEVVEKAKGGEFKGSSLGKALELELALEQAREFESNKMDVWMRITARAKQMEADAAKAERRRKEAKKRRQDEIDELILIIVALLATVTVLGLTFYFVMEAMQRQY
jgi:ABC-type phosphate transport system permease subunit